MKKLFTLFLVLAGIVMTVNADNERTVYYAVQSSTVGKYTVKLNINIGDNNTWRQYDMSNTGLTYTANNITYDVYYCKCWEKYGGVDVMQFQLYDGNTWKSQEQPISSWNSEFDNKMYVEGSSRFIDFSANYIRTNLNEGKYGTLCLPWAATIEGGTIFKIVSTVVENETLKAINLKSVESLEAGHAYIFKATGSTLTAICSGTYADAIEADGMIGNLSATPVTVAAGNYVLSGNKICPVGEKVTIDQYRAYITLNGIGAAASRGANFIGFDEATGIDNIKAENGQEVVYNLQGQRVTDAQKGLVIMGGKKMLRK